MPHLDLKGIGRIVHDQSRQNCPWIDRRLALMHPFFWRAERQVVILVCKPCVIGDKGVDLNCTLFTVKVPFESTYL
jgi:hypothetical protein